MKLIKRTWVVLLSVILFCLTKMLLEKVYTRFYSSPSGALGETIGYSLIPSLIVFLCAGFIRKRLKKKKFEFWMLCFSVTFCFVGAYEVVKINRQSHQLKSGMQAMAPLIEDSLKVDTVEDYSSKEYGDFAFLLPMIEKSSEFSNKMLLEVARAGEGIDDILLPDNLQSLEKITESKGLSKRFFDKIDEYERLYHEEVASLELAITQTHFENSDLKRGVLSGIKSGKEKTGSLMETFFQVEKDVAKSMIETLTFFEIIQGDFSFTEGELFFTNDWDADRCGVLFANIVELANQEEMVMQELEDYREARHQRWEEVQGLVN